MTPKEKADSLYESMYYKIPNYPDETNEHLVATKCALVAVEDKIDDYEGLLHNCYGEAQTAIKQEIDYYKEVKKELEKEIKVLEK